MWLGQSGNPCCIRAPGGGARLRQGHIDCETALRAAEEAGFEIRDVEFLREFHARPLLLGVANLQEHAAELPQIAAAPTLRMWLLYMAGSVAAFERGDISDCQILLHPRHRGHDVELRTREECYAKKQCGSNTAAA